MQIRVLGPVDVVDDDGNNVQIGGPTQSRVLAMLVAAQPGAASVDDLVDGLWPGELPDDPVGTIRTYIARLRRSLGPETIVTEAGAYRLAETPTDAVRFVELVDRARRSSGSPTVAEVWQRALDLWRGPAFGDHADLEIVGSEAARLEELRAEATEACFDARLAAGEGRELVADLEIAVEAFPLREGFRAQQMTVLARAGRAPEALRAFQDFRGDLTDVGLGPSARLVELDREISAGKMPRSGARRTLRGYELGERLGEGAFAVVHQATQASVGRDVAIKQIRGSLADQPEFIRQFEAEAHLVARLEHPHIVPLYDFWREPGSAYLVMRYVDGGSVAGRILDSPLELNEVVAIVSQVASALDVAHSAGVIHRDVKPANVLLDSTGNAYLGDFGIAVEEAERLDPEAWLSNGSPAYAPPEQLQREAVGPTADVYALAMTAFEALTGQLPFQNETTMAGLIERQLHDPIPLVRTVDPGLPAAVDTVLQRATAKQPDARYESAGAFANDLAAAAGLEGDDVLVAPQDRNPYKGLAAFSEADAGDFTGRDRLVSELLEATGGRRVVLVVGPSGSGKSSAVRAGLLPAIRGGSIAGSERWFVTSMTPDVDPFESLAAALMRVAVDPPADLVAQLRTGSSGLAKMVRQIVPADRELLLVVDQFEELFTLTSDTNDVDLFLDGLVEALREERPRLRLVATLRADFYDHPLRHPKFAKLVRSATVPVHPLEADELERSMVGPAAAVGAAFEPGLVAEITADIADQPGALPLLQYTLTELYDERDGQTLTRDAYQRLGGVRGSLARRAEELFIALSPEAQGEAQQVFGRLVSLGEGTEDTRRRVLRPEIGDRPGVAEVVESFGSARLLSFDRDTASREPTLEVAHEALIREWPRFRDWIDEDRDGLRILQHIRTAARDWDEAGRPETELYQGGRLESAEDWQAEHRSSMTDIEALFVEEGVARREAEIEGKRKTDRRLRRLLVGVAVVAALALIAGSVAFIQRNDAQQARTDAENERADAVSARDDEADARADAEDSAELAEIRRLVSDAGVIVEDNPDLALLLAAEAHRRADTPQTLAGLQAVLTGTGALLGTIGAGEDFWAARWTENGEIVGLTEDEVLVFDGYNGTELRRDSLPSAISDEPFGFAHRLSVVDNAIAVGLVDGRVALIEDEQLDVLDVAGSPIGSLALSPDGQQLLVGDFDGFVHLIERSSGEVLWSIQAITVFRFEEMISAEDWPFFSWLEEFDHEKFRTGPRTMVFDEDTVLVAFGVDLLRLDLASGELIARFRAIGEQTVGLPPIPRAIFDFHLGPQGDITLGVGLDEVFYLDADFELSNKTEIPRDATIQSTLKLVVTDDDRLWSISSGGVLDTGPVGASLANGQSFATTASLAWDLDLSPDQREVVIAGSGGIVRWAISGQQLLAESLPAGDAAAVNLTGNARLIYVGTPSDPAAASIVYDRARDSVPVQPHPQEGIDYLTVGSLRGEEDNVVAVTHEDGWWNDVRGVDPETLEFIGPTLTDVGFGAAYSPDGQQLAVGRYFAPSFRVVATDDGRELSPTFDLGPWALPAPGMGSIAFDPRRPRVVGAVSPVAMIVNTETWEMERIVGPEEGGGPGTGISAVAYAADADILVTRDYLGAIVQRDPETFEELRRIDGGTAGIAFGAEGPYLSADGEYLLTVRDDVPRLWHLPSATLIGAFPTDDGKQHDGATSKEVLRLATLVGGHALIWNLETDGWMDIACRAAGRNLSQEEMGPIWARR